MRILFVFFTDPPRPFSSAIASLSAAAGAAGHRCEALEIPWKSSIDAAAREIERRAPQVLGITAMSRDWPGVRALLSRLRGPKPLVVAGGYHASLAPRDVATCAEVDAICIGEGERPLVALLDRLEAGEVPRTSPGLWVRGEEGFSGSPPPADPEPDIAALPLWDYELFGGAAILDHGVNTFGPHVDRYLPTRASRGCPFTCSYCSAPVWGKLGGFQRRELRNVRPVAHLCDELAALRDRYRPDGFEFWDEHFPLDEEWLEELAREYPARVGLPFKLEMHPSAATRRRLELVARAGCSLFHCGVESGDEELRRGTLNRRTRDAELSRVFDDCRDLGLATSASVMTALPGETREQALSTVSLLRRLRPDSFMWSTYLPLPHTPLGDASVSDWSAVSQVRFDDYPKPLGTAPPALGEADRVEVFRELAELQASLVKEASLRASAGSRPRPLDVPARARPAPPALARSLGLLPLDAPDDAGVRARTAAWEGDVLLVEIEGGGLPPRRISLARADGARSYRSTPHLAISYSGHDAPAPLLQVIDRIAAAVAPLHIEDLRRMVRE